MIIEFGIENFGSIKEKQTLSFEADDSTHLEEHYVLRPEGGPRLLKLALIYGANASGKTTVLRALSFLKGIVLAPLQTKTAELNFEPFLFDEKTIGQITNLSIRFIHHEVIYLYEVGLTKSAIVSEALHFFEPKKALVYKRTTDLENQLSEIQFGSKIKREKSLEQTLTANTLWNNTVLGGFLKTNIEQAQLKAATDWFKSYLYSMVDAKSEQLYYIIQRLKEGKVKKEDMINVLKAADFNIFDFSMDRAKHIPDNVNEALKILLKGNNAMIEQIGKNIVQQVYFQHQVGDKTYELPIEQESGGSKRYFEFAGFLSLLIRNSIVLPIDELEASLHPELYLHFILSFLLNANHSQLIATTHNREILDNKDIFRNDVIWFTDKSENCATELYSLIDFDSSVIRDTSNILNAYKSGKLRGMPNLGDPYVQLGL